MKKLFLLLAAVVGLTLLATPKAEAYVRFSVGFGGYYPYGYYAGYPAYDCAPYSYGYGPRYRYYGGYYPRYYRRGYYVRPRRVVYYHNGRRYHRRGYYARR